jgi:hypothetical protein
MTREALARAEAELPSCLIWAGVLSSETALPRCRRASGPGSKRGSQPPIPNGHGLASATPTVAVGGRADLPYVCLDRQFMTDSVEKL